MTSEDPEVYLRRSGRFELKYLINREQCNSILDRLRYFMRLDANCEKRGSYVNRSLYFDTIGFKEFHEYINGEKRRRKFRLRKYSVDSPIVNLEIKHKLNKIVWKDKVRVDQGVAFDLFSNPWKYADSEEFSTCCYQIAKRKYEPKCTVVYDRIALHGIIDDGVRVTFDHNLRTGGPDLFGRQVEGSDLRVLPPGILVMEVKFSNRIPRWCDKLISDFQLSYRTYSKYVECIQRIYGFDTIINR